MRTVQERETARKTIRSESTTPCSQETSTTTLDFPEDHQPTLRGQHYFKF